MDPRVHAARDSLVGMGLILEAMATSGKTVSDMVAAIPSYEIKKLKMDCPRDKGLAIIEQLTSELSDGTPNTEDGLRIDFDRSWVQVRLSNTEPIIRLMAEAESEEAVNQVLARVIQVAENILGG